MSNKPISEVIEKIKSAAGKATPGPWSAFCKTHRKGGTFALHTPDDWRCGNIINWQGFDGNEQPKYRNAANVKYMALVNPENITRLIDHIAALEQQLAAERADKRRMDWLVSHYVEVRTPLVYGSHALFVAQVVSEDWAEEHATSLREQIDAAMKAAGLPVEGE